MKFKNKLIALLCIPNYHSSSNNHQKQFQMKTFLIIYMSGLLMLSYSCSNGQTQKTLLSPAQFAEKITQTPTPSIIDVRTPGEYADGHLINAVNMDWNGNNFDAQIATLDKSKPVFVYCQAGGRSAAAAKKMRSVGFKEVYDLDGGFSEWQAAKLPETH
jgi:rhodanese-related sulfurtransferase